MSATSTRLLVRFEQLPRPDSRACWQTIVAPAGPEAADFLSFGEDPNTGRLRISTGIGPSPGSPGQLPDPVMGGGNGSGSGAGVVRLTVRNWTEPFRFSFVNINAGTGIGANDNAQVIYLSPIQYYTEDCTCL